MQVITVRSANVGAAHVLGTRGGGCRAHRWTPASKTLSWTPLPLPRRGAANVVREGGVLAVRAIATEAKRETAKQKPSAEKVSGKTVLVTGASDGTGREAARLFAKKGYNVVLAARERSQLEEAAEEVRSLAQQRGRPPNSVLAVPTDISNFAAVENLASDISERFATLNVVVNNAGVCQLGAFLDTEMDTWQEIVAVNLLGHVAVSKALLPALMASRGALVFVGSIGGKVPIKNMSAYCTSKHAASGLAESLRLEFEPRGVHVAQVHPGIVNTGFIQRAPYTGPTKEQSKERTQKFLDSNLPGVVQQPEDIAHAVWLCSQRKHREIVVGPAFKFTAAVYRLFGIDLASINPLYEKP